MSTKALLLRPWALTIVIAVSSLGGALWSGCATPRPARSMGSDSSSGAGDSSSSSAEAARPGASGAAPLALAPVKAGRGEIGGRFFDKWFEGKAFKPDDAKTPAADGQGGPFGNGRLKAEDGKELNDTSGHQTRLKNLFGWDLRGADGIYGPKYQNKKYVLPINLLTTTASREDLVRWFTWGQEGIPAYGDVLAPAEIGELADFIVAMREGRLARPEQVFDLSTTAPGNYTLRPGGDAVRGASLIKERCARCHGGDGTKLLFDDDELTLGMHARQEGYEDWMKILNGQPGSPMGRQVAGGDGTAMAKEILDILAALCDRRAFPRGHAKGEDVADGDPRCGSYLR